MKEGISLRDYFAGQALIGITERLGSEAYRRYREHVADGREAVVAYGLADAMLHAREKDPQSRTAPAPNRDIEALLAELAGGIRDCDRAGVDPDDSSKLTIGFSPNLAKRVYAELRRLVTVDEERTSA
jgi:hypothetical protein